MFLEQLDRAAPVAHRRYRVGLGRRLHRNFDLVAARLEGPVDVLVKVGVPSFCF